MARAQFHGGKNRVLGDVQGRLIATVVGSMKRLSIPCARCFCSEDFTFMFYMSIRDWLPGKSAGDLYGMMKT